MSNLSGTGENLLALSFSSEVRLVELNLDLDYLASNASNVDQYSSTYVYVNQL